MPAVQLNIDYSKRLENNRESQAILDANKARLNNQCRIVLEALLRGERLTTATALLKYGVGDLRRRIADLIERGIEVKKELKQGRYKEYFL
jgi:hypothetical protein